MSGAKRAVSDIGERMQFLEAVDAGGRVGGGKWVLLVAARSRLSRDLYVGAIATRMVERAGGEVESATEAAANGDDPTAKLMSGLLDLLAAHERAVIGLRTSRALRAKMARGEHVGAPGVGKRVVVGEDGARRLEDDPAEMLVVGRILELREAGESLRGIAATLTAEGVATKYGGTWTHKQVGSVLRRFEQTEGAAASLAKATGEDA